MRRILHSTNQQVRVEGPPTAPSSPILESLSDPPDSLLHPLSLISIASPVSAMAHLRRTARCCAHLRHTPHPSNHMQLPVINPLVSIVCIRLLLPCLVTFLHTSAIGQRCTRPSRSTPSAVSTHYYRSPHLILSFKLLRIAQVGFSRTPNAKCQCFD